MLKIKSYYMEMSAINEKLLSGMESFGILGVETESVGEADYAITVDFDAEIANKSTHQEMESAMTTILTGDISGVKIDFTIDEMDSDEDQLIYLVNVSYPEIIFED